MKYCGDCKQTKDLEDFHRLGTGQQSVCKECARRRSRLHYRNNRERHQALAKARLRELRGWAATLKSGPCTDCGGTFHHRAMHWDHIANDKAADVSVLVAAGSSKGKILNEIAKCELVCANCHAVRTFEREIEGKPL